MNLQWVRYKLMVVVNLKAETRIPRKKTGRGEEKEGGYSRTVSATEITRGI